MAQPVRAYLISFLATQHAVDPDRFAVRYPAPWLVWEAGAWTAPSGPTMSTVSTARPRLPGKGGDALCFELALDAGGALTAGRNPELPMVINDGTFSREQFVFGRPDAHRYTVTLVARAQPATINGGRLGGAPQLLGDGDAIAAGAVTLRFHAPKGFLGRLTAMGVR